VTFQASASVCLFGNWIPSFRDTYEIPWSSSPRCLARPSFRMMGGSSLCLPYVAFQSLDCGATLTTQVWTAFIFFIAITVVRYLLNGLISSLVECCVQNTKEQWLIRGLRPQLVHTRNVLVKNHTCFQRQSDALQRAPVVFLISCSLHLYSVTTMLASSFGRMWGWLAAMCAVSADHKCLGVSTLVLKTVTDGDVGGPYLLLNAVLHS
jgi:hypothetical protein